MAFGNRDDIAYEQDPNGPNIVIDEMPGSASFIALRKVRWNPASDFKLDIRKYFMKSNGDEVASKGVSFITEDGPENLIKGLLGLGFCSTRSALDVLSKRNDYLDALKYSMDLLNEEEKEPATEMLNKLFDMRKGED